MTRKYLPPKGLRHEEEEEHPHKKKRIAKGGPTAKLGRRRKRALGGDAQDTNAADDWNYDNGRTFFTGKGLPASGFDPDELVGPTLKDELDRRPARMEGPYGGPGGGKPVPPDRPSRWNFPQAKRGGRIKST